MNTYSRSHLTNDALLRELRDTVTRDHAVTAELLACLAEVDRRQLYRPAGYPTMSAYCIRELRFSEDMAWKRIQAARVARRFPAIFTMLAEGRLHLSGVCLLAPHLTRFDGMDLIHDAWGKTKAEIELMLAQRFPTTERLEMVVQIPAIVGPPALPPSLGSSRKGERTEPPPALGQVVSNIGTGFPSTFESEQSPAPGQVTVSNMNTGVPSTAEEEGSPGPGQAIFSAPSAGDASVSWPATESIRTEAPRMTPPSLRPTMTPVAYERFAVEFMMDRQMHEDLRRAQALLGHQVPTGELGRIFGRALQSLIRELEKNKFGVRRPGADGERAAMPVTSANPRYIPKHVRRLVWERDQGRCTFVGESGQRCPATNALEFDHVQPVAQGGTSAPGNLRLRCRAHNQLDAEREFGPEYMAEMRQRAPSS